MSSIFNDFVSRRRELREMLDHFGKLIFDIMSGLSDQIQLIDPVNDLPLLRTEFERIKDGSINVALVTSNSRELTMYLQSNGDVRVVSSLALSPVSDDYVDIILKDNGEAAIVTEREEMLLQDYIFGWAVSAFEE